MDMNVLWNVDQLMDYLGTWSAVKLYNDEFKTDIIDEIKPEMMKIMKGSEMVKMDFSVYIGRNTNIKAGNT